jgi:hypothetical protein
MVGDRGMITSARIDALKADAGTGLGWITALARARDRQARPRRRPPVSDGNSITRPSPHDDTPSPGCAFTFTMSNTRQ